MTARSPVAVVVATYARPAFLEDALRSITASLDPRDELVVVEGGASEAADLVHRSRAPAVHLEVTPPGKSRQLNVAVRRATAEVLLFTDDDCVVDPAWPDAMAAPFADPQVSIAFGPVRGLTHVPGSSEAPTLPPGEAPFETWSYAHGASMAVRRSALVAVGGFDERLGPGAPAHGEEHDLVLRLRARGDRVAIAAAPAVEHVGWRSEDEHRSNALVYERGAGAFLGAAMRRDRHDGWPLLKHRLGYQWQLLRDRSSRDPRFAWRAAAAFVGGFTYGIRLPPWRSPARD